MEKTQQGAAEEKGPEVVVLTREDLEHEIERLVNLIQKQSDAIRALNSEDIGTAREHFEQAVTEGLAEWRKHLKSDIDDPLNSERLDQLEQDIAKGILSNTDDYLFKFLDRHHNKQIEFLRTEIEKYLSPEFSGEKQNISNSFVQNLQKYDFKIAFNVALTITLTLTITISIAAYLMSKDTAHELVHGVVKYWMSPKSVERDPYVDDLEQRIRDAVRDEIDKQFDPKGNIFMSMAETVMEVNNNLGEPGDDKGSAHQKLDTVTAHLNGVGDALANIQSDIDILKTQGVDLSPVLKGQDELRMAQMINAKKQAVMDENLDAFGRSQLRVLENQDSLMDNQKQIVTKQDAALTSLGNLKTLQEALASSHAEFRVIYDENVLSEHGERLGLEGQIEIVSTDVSALSGQIYRAQEDVVEKLRTVSLACENADNCEKGALSSSGEGYAGTVKATVAEAVDWANKIAFDTQSGAADFEASILNPEAEYPVGLIRFANSYFDSGEFAPKAILRANATRIGREALNLAWEGSQNGPEDDFRVVIIGFTDRDTHTHFGRDNCWLSKQRAAWFADIILQDMKRGDSGFNNIYLYGMGKERAQLFGQNKGPDRRIEVYFGQDRAGLETVLRERLNLTSAPGEQLGPFCQEYEPRLWEEPREQVSNASVN